MADFAYEALFQGMNEVHARIAARDLRRLQK
jgi:hypothetical protein